MSAETIYKTLFIESRGVLARELCAHLRSGRPMRRSVHNTVTRPLRGQINGAVSIADRPAEIEDRVIPGLVARDVSVAGARTARDHVGSWDRGIVGSWDRGMELANHHEVTANTGLDVYFADPTVRGNAVPIRTPIACYDSIFRRAHQWVD